MPDIQSVIQKLQSEDEKSRSEAAANLGRLGPRAAEAIPALEKIAMNESEAEPVRRAAIYSLARIGKESLPCFRRIIEYNNTALIRRLSSSLGPMVALGEEGADAIDLIIRLTKLSDRETRLNAIVELKEFARTAPIYLHKKAMESDSQIAMPAILGLSYVNRNSSKYSARIVAELKCAKSDELELPIIALGYADVKLSAEIVSILSGAIGSKSKDIRYSAVDAVCEKEKYLDDLILRTRIENAASDEDPFVSSRAIWGLCLRGHYSKHFLQLALKNASTDKVDSDVRRASILALGYMGAKAVGSLEVLKSLQTDPEFGEEADVAYRMIQKSLKK